MSIYVLGRDTNNQLVSANEYEKMKQIVHRVSWVKFNRWGTPGNWSSIHLITHRDYYNPRKTSKALCSRTVPAEQDAADWGLGRKTCDQCYEIARKRGLEIDE